MPGDSYCISHILDNVPSPSPLLIFVLVDLELRTGIFIFVFSFLFAPILHSLLATVSTDTIYALSSLFLMINWIFLDYRTHSEEYMYEPGSNTTAISSSLLATLCLASRLPTAHHTFALLQAWTIIFALWPILVQLIRVNSCKFFNFIRYIMSRDCRVFSSSEILIGLWAKFWMKDGLCYRMNPIICYLLINAAERTLWGTFRLRFNCRLCHPNSFGHSWSFADF